jgi:pantoate--beta-alanine ligase
MTKVDELQYLELRDAGTLEAIQGPVERPAALCVAAYVGTTRLIDNVLLTPPPTALSDRDLAVVSYAVDRRATAGAQGSPPS